MEDTHIATATAATRERIDKVVNWGKDRNNNVEDRDTVSLEMYAETKSVATLAVQHIIHRIFLRENFE